MPIKNVKSPTSLWPIKYFIALTRTQNFRNVVIIWYIIKVRIDHELTCMYFGHCIVFSWYICSRIIYVLVLPSTNRMVAIIIAKLMSATKIFSPPLLGYINYFIWAAVCKVKICFFSTQNSCSIWPPCKSSIKNSMPYCLHMATAYHN